MNTFYCQKFGYIIDRGVIEGDEALIGFLAPNPSPRTTTAGTHTPTSRRWLLFGVLAVVVVSGVIGCLEDLSSALFIITTSTSKLIHDYSIPSFPPTSDRFPINDSIMVTDSNRYPPSKVSGASILSESQLFIHNE